MVSFRTESSSLRKTFHMRACPCIPLNEPWWQSLHKGTQVRWLSCSMWWASDGPSSPHTPHGISLMRAMCMRSTAVLLLWFLLNIASCPYGGGARRRSYAKLGRARIAPLVASINPPIFLLLTHFCAGFSFIHSGKPNKIVDEVKMIHQCFVYLAIYRKATYRQWSDFVNGHPACAGSQFLDVSFTWRHL